MPTKLFFLFYCLSIGCRTVSAQSNAGTLSPSDTNSRYDIRQYNSENGLPQNSVTGLILDKNNFLWVTTQNGLVRFDGQRFRIYNKSNTLVIKSNRFSIITESSQHEVLLRSSFDPSVIYKVTPDYRLVVDSARMRTPYKFIGTNSNGIFDCSNLLKYYTEHRDTTITLSFLIKLFSSEEYENFLVLNEHEIIIRDRQLKWYYLNNVTGEVIALPVSFKNSNPFYLSLDGIFCIFGEDRKLYFFKQGKQISMQVDKTFSDLIKGAFSILRFGIFVNLNCNQVLARSGDDIYELSIRDGVLKATLIFKDLEFLKNQLPTSFLFDKNDQRLFVGTVTTGFFVVTKKLFHTVTFNANDSLNNAFKAFLLMPGKRILTQTGILDKNRESNNRSFKWDSMPDGYCLYKARDQTIWLSRVKHLYVYDSSFSRKIRMDSLPLESYINCIIEDQTHTVWVSTLASLLKIEEGRLKYVIRRYPAFINHTIESIVEVSPGIIWIATRDGLYSYDIARDKIAEKPILPGVYARSIFMARDKSIWIGTYGNGYYKYEGGHFIPLPLDAKKYLATAHTFLEDDNGFFWISTNHGLFRVKKRDLDNFVKGSSDGLFYYYFDQSYGFNTNEFNGGCNPASLKDEEGNFYFPSLAGIVYFNPVNVHPELPDKAIVVDNFMVDSLFLNYRNGLRIPPDFNQVVVEVTSPFYGLEDNLQLEYKINPIGEKWYPVNKDGRIVINRLSDGKYTLLIRKRNGLGGNDFTSTDLPFEVRPHWYHTWLFYLLLAVAICCFLLLLLRLRTRLLLRQNMRLQMKVDERTFELEKTAVIKEKLVSVIMHDLRSPLFSQLLLIDHLYSKYNGINGFEFDEMLFQLKDSSKRICQFSTDFLTWYDSQKENFQVQKGRIGLESFIKETTVFYKEIATGKGLSFSYDISSSLLLVSDENILAIVIRNLVDNAVKYTRSGEVLVRAYEKEGSASIEIRDTGGGISASKIEELLSYRENDINNSIPTFGYRFIIELTDKLKGKLNIESKSGKGTIVTVSFGT